MARGATWDPELEERGGTAIGAELRALGATLTGAVCVHLLHHSASWTAAQRSLSNALHDSTGIRLPQPPCAPERVGATLQELPEAHPSRHSEPMPAFSAASPEPQMQ